MHALDASKECLPRFSCAFHQVNTRYEIAMKIEKLLFVTQFERLWFDALQSLLTLRKAALNHVVFLNVIDRDKVAMYRGAGYRKSEEIKLREIANVRFIDWAEKLFEQGLEVGVHIVVGNVVQKAISVAEFEEADLIVIEKPKSGAIEQFYSQSEVTEIVTRTSVPVLVHNYPGEDASASETLFASPLLVTDGSPGSDRAAAYLKGLAGLVGHVSLIRVAREKQLKGDSVMKVQELRKESRKELEALCDEFEALGVETESHLYIGDAEIEIERAARECRATMIVVSEPGTGAWTERFRGSIASKLAEKSSLPTMIVPGRGKGSKS